MTAPPRRVARIQSRLTLLQYYPTITSWKLCTAYFSKLVPIHFRPGRTSFITSKITHDHIFTSSLAHRVTYLNTPSTTPSPTMSDKLDKKVIKEGNKQDYPKKGDQIAMNYTGWLYDAGASDNRGKQQVSSQLCSTPRELTFLQVR